jgi:hypothetical protein
MKNASSGTHHRFFDLSERQQAIIAMLVGIVCLVFSENSIFSKIHFIPHLVRDVGIALIVSACLIVTIEKINKARGREERDEFVRAVGDNLIKAVYNRELPLPLFDTIRRSLLEQPFIRSEYNVNVSLYDLDDSYLARAPAREKAVIQNLTGRFRKDPLFCPSPVIMKAHAHFRVCNVTSEIRDYDVVWSMRKPFGKSYEDVCGITSLKIDQQEQIQIGVFSSDETHIVNSEFHKTVAIAPQGSAHVSLECYCIRSCDDNEPWRTMIPCDGIHASVVDHNNNKEVYIAVDAPVSFIDEHTAQNQAEKSGEMNRVDLSVRRFLLPYQGLTIYWSRNRRSSSNHSIRKVGSK